VHKLSYIDRSMFDKFNPTQLIARLNVRPIDPVAVRDMVEYLWFIENYEILGANALATITRESVDTAWCVVYHIGMIKGDFGI
jgi:hypothetical protein